MKKKSIIFNILLILLEVIAFTLILNTTSKINFQFYTEDSNILALISSIIYIYFLCINKKIPRWVQLFKYMTTIGLTLTFLVVIFILTPMYNFNYSFMLLEGSMLYLHLLCPIIGIITFIFFDQIDISKKGDIFKGMLFTIIYGIVLIILNILGIVNGPYPFLMVRNQTVIASIIWSTIVIGLTYIIARLLKVASIKVNKRKEK